MKNDVCRLYQAKQLVIEEDIITLPKQDEVQIKVAYAGICGTDLHYYYHGGFGKIRLQEPLILGHEFCGTVHHLPAAYSGNLKIGNKVAINPSKACGTCKFCQSHQHNHCLNMKFFGSAMLFPHIQGGFRNFINVHHSQCHKLCHNFDLQKAAVIEPLAVSLHASGLCSELKNKKVLITGAGPIGCLMAAVCQYKGAAEIVVTDVVDNTLNIAKKLGATKVINVVKNQDDLERYKLDKGYFDICFECSSAATAILLTFEATRPRGEIVLIGMLGEMSLAMNLIQQKEIRLTSSFRFNESFASAVELLQNNAIHIDAIISKVFNYKESQQAIDFSSDRNQSVKVLLEF